MRRETGKFEIIRKKRRKLTKLYLILKMYFQKTCVKMDGNKPDNLQRMFHNYYRILKTVQIFKTNGHIGDI
jgi:hypothetical protein